MLLGASAHAAPDLLVRRVLDKLNEKSPIACLGLPVKALAGKEGAPPGRDPEIATIRRLLDSVSEVANRPEAQRCMEGSLLALAEKAHVRIQDGAAEVLVRTSRPEELNASLAPHARTFAGVPYFKHPRVQPLYAGVLDVGPLKGVFVEYRSCQETCRPLTLLAFDTPLPPEAQRVVYNNHEYFAAWQNEHTLLAWRGERDGWLYVVITHCALKNAIALAELLRAPAPQPAQAPAQG